MNNSKNGVDENPLLDEQHNLSSQINNESYNLDEIPEVKSIVLINISRGAVIVAAIYLASSLIDLSTMAAGCNIDAVTECNSKIYGFKPSSLITMISIVAGLLVAFTMPIIGSILDFTSARRKVGIWTGCLLWLAQSIEFFTNESTWLIMSIIQALSIFFFTTHLLAVTSYLPSIGRKVGEERMGKLSAILNIAEFCSCLFFVILINVIAIVANIGDIQISKVNQGINFVFLLPIIAVAWKDLPDIPAQTELLPTEGQLICAGFSQMWRTAQKINMEYHDGLQWFFLATVFAEAGMSAFSSISLVYLVEVLDMSSTEIGIIYLLVFFSIVPGSFLGAKATRLSNPITSWKNSLYLFSIVTIVATFVLTGPKNSSFAYLWAILWGCLMGWFYSVEELLFSLMTPKSDESGLTGFYVYCRSVLTWLPPLIFTVMNEAGFALQYGFLILVAFFSLALICLNRMASWDWVYKNNEKELQA